MLNGLKPKTKDKRDIKLGAFVSLPDAPDCDFMVTDRVWIKQQAADDCTAYASCAVSEDQEEVELVTDYTFNKTKKGDLSWGAELRDACKAHTKFGAIEVLDWKEPKISREKVITSDFSAYDPIAIKHKKKAFAEVILTKKDYFDSIRAALWNYRSAKCSVLSGITWYQSWSGEAIISNEIGVAIGGHAIKYCGQKIINGVPYLVMQNSGGENIGDRGFFYVSRSIVNKYAKKYGAYMFVDLSPEELAELIRQAKIGIIGRLLNYLKELLSIEISKKK